MPFSVSVKHGKSVCQLTVDEDTKIVTLMGDVEKLISVPVQQQKLIFQGKVLDPSSSVKNAKLKDGSKLMLMASGGQTQVLVPVGIAIARVGSSHFAVTPCLLSMLG